MTSPGRRIGCCTGNGLLRKLVADGPLASVAGRGMPATEPQTTHSSADRAYMGGHAEYAASLSATGEAVTSRRRGDGLPGGTLWRQHGMPGRRPEWLSWPVAP